MYDTIVVGGGIAGLSCALNLSNVLVLEGSNYWGGRIKTHYDPQYEIGAGRFHKNHKRLWSLIQRFNLTPIPIEKQVDYIDQHDGFIPNVNLYMHSLIKKLHLHESLRTKTFYDYCVSELGEDAIHFANAFGFHEMYYKNAYDFLQSYQKDFSQDFFVLKEGMSKLCLCMKNEIKGECLLNHRVKKIEKIGNHIEVDGYRAKRVIVTIPPSLFKQFPILSPFDPIHSFITQGPLLRIYAKYPTPSWFDHLHTMTTKDVLRHIIPIRDGIIMIAYVEDRDIEPFIKKGELKTNDEIGKMIKDSLSRLFPLEIPDPLWIRPYLWKIGTHAWLPCNSEKLLKSLPTIENVHVCGEAFSMTQSWVEGALESSEEVLSNLDKQ